MSSDAGKSVPVLKEILVEDVMAPLTPEKPMVPGQRPIYPNGQALPNPEYIMAEKEEYLSRFTQRNQVEMPIVSNEEYLSTFDGGANQARGGTPLYETPTQFSESMSNSSFISCGSSMVDKIVEAARLKETGPFTQWTGMTFQDLLALNIGAGTSIGGNPTSNGFLSHLGSQCPPTALLSENQESIGLRGSYRCDQDIMAGIPRFNQSLEFQQNNVNPDGSRPVIMMNAFPDGFIPEIAPATPDHSRRLQESAASSKTSFPVDKHPSKQNGEGNQLSVVDDLLGINGTQSPTGSVAMESYNPDLDLNKTIEQKPRRRKHRPKVVREVKPKQPLKERKPKPTDANVTPTQKRKYVRIKKTDIPSTTPPESGTEALGSKIPDPAVKSCRKALNFDMEDQGKGKDPTDAKETPRRKRKYVRKNKTNIPSTPPLESGAEALDCKTPEPAVKSCRKALNFDIEDQVQEKSLSHTLTDATPSEQLPQDLFLSKEKGVTMDATQECSAYTSMSEREAQSIPHPTKATPSEHEFHAATEYESGKERENLTAFSLQKANSTDVLHPTNFLACSPNYSTCTSANEGEHTRGLKRANSCPADTRNVGTENLMNHCTLSQANCMSMGNAIFSCTHGMYFPESRKKRKSEKVLLPKTSDILSSTDVEDTRAATSSQNYPREAAKNSKYYFSILVPHFNISAEANSRASAVTNHQDDTPLINWGDIDKLKMRSKDTKRVGDLDLLKGLEECEKTSKSPAKGRVRGTRKKNVKACNASCTEDLSLVSNAKKKDTRRSRKKNSAAKSVTSSFNMVYMHSLKLFDRQNFTGNSKGPFLALPWIDTSSINVDAIVEGMKQLDINREGSSVQYQEQNSLIPFHAQNQQLNALVLYQRAGVIVPFEGTKSSKRRPRAKVDLDDETNRVWNLLLEDINNQGIDGTGEEKQKWWEEERTVFRGRVDSFIARMRLVQGDRRFSPWKGSVVDSVVGVFLTQNVSDHLSSSAFMSVAARYPLKSANKARRESEEEFDSSVIESEICIVEIDDSSDTSALNEKTVEGSICDRRSRTLHDTDVGDEKAANSKGSHGCTDLTDDTWCLSHSSQGKTHESQLYTSSFKESEIPSTPIDGRAIDDATSSQHSVISSQNSAESSGVPTSRKMGLCSDNSSEGEGPTKRSNPSSVHSASFVELLKMAETPMLHATYAPKDQVPSSQSDLPNQEETVKYHLQAVDESRSVNSVSLGENLATEPSEATAESATESHLHKKASVSNMGSNFPSDNVCSYYVLEGKQMIFQSLRQPVREQEDTTNPLTEGSISLQMNVKLPTVSREDVTPESTCASNSTIYDKAIPIPPLSDHIHSLGEADNAKKQETGKIPKTPKKASYDWDSLRRQAQANGSTIRQRTTSTMDSVDWEAVRCADVHEIADTIKERGMNNRLAERIQEFLNRIVNDHGNIDLEWLRDVPPDKAKEYLLSIRGLGLKSVECVRLLTLHHLAFPVDTNVGRIAVRLGWVPLQPLPESLQLHLLELYPILESIQKYLWPRLCKLDQKTLYELHYHMITFGKVFCTKRQPNCNACPLRGECRHFASAFASARLALPGPQDRSIVLSDQSNMTHQDPQVTINSLPLTLPMTDKILETKSDASNCEPIVEMPASPEPEPEHIQTSECDIEDAFSEDPNEIPTIKLNMEEFTQTLQAYMQSNKELQEGDMSKALVALASEAASIPTPKLKNVSRLRTEHHVYELPDTHQLLRGLDRREPDDPCPYLLAIWSPGETANSIEPPQKRCNFQEPGELCSDETCYYCSSQRETNSQIVRGTLLIPCRTAMRGSFPLNGTYFQVNEVFADHESSLNPIQVPRALLWNLPRRNVYFGTSIPTIFKGLSTEGIQHCFWRGYVCVRGFDQKTRAPRPLMARLHISAYKLAQARGKS